MKRPQIAPGLKGGIHLFRLRQGELRRLGRKALEGGIERLDALKVDRRKAQARQDACFDPTGKLWQTGKGYVFVTFRQGTDRGFQSRFCVIGGHAEIRQARIKA